MRIDDQNGTVDEPTETGEQDATVRTGEPTTTGEPQTMAELLAESERAGELRPLRTGEVVEGTVSRINADEVLVDLGGRSAGILSLREADEELHPGDTIMAYVERPEGPDGHAVLSLRKARRERRWLKLREMERSGEVSEVRVVEANRGGVVVDIGLRGFVPLSQLSSVGAVDRPDDPSAPPQALSDLVGTRLNVKVLEVDPKRDRLILSEKAAAQEIRRRRKARAAAELHEGDVLGGTVTQVAGFGLFVDVGVAEGLVHRSEITWDKSINPLSAHRVGDRVRVKVIGVDRERGRISLSIRQLEADPWARVGTEVRLGQDYEGTITKLMAFGAFARIAEGLEGLIHVSELSSERVADPADVVHVGDRVNVRVVGIEPERRRLSLSIRQAGR
ncbi:MAG: 30S ribosomal protein S1 [Chloroflexota bacterium]|nr:S1 RNA-binding domain-containing protein [Chloroflexota bacterium]MDE3102246.1 30S ribosomal protein S1 [Chloroflexota bacterium]